MRKPIVLTIAFLLTSLTASWAQNESLLIGPGDLIQVEVIDTPEMGQQVRVTDAGNVPLAYVGEVHVAGETPGAAAGTITQALVTKGVMRHPQVTVRVQEYATQDVSILGQVKTPGTYSITTTQPIEKMLSLSGGLTDMANRRVIVKRHGSSKEESYYVSNNPDPTSDGQLMVNPGDTIIVPRAAIVYIMGDVNRPGGYAISTNDSHLTVLQAITMAGSTNKTAIQSHVRLLRTTPNGQVELQVRLDEMEKGKLPDMALQSNDILYVPFSWMKNIAMNGSAVAASTASAAIYAIP